MKVCDTLWDIIMHAEREEMNSSILMKELQLKIGKWREVTSFYPEYNLCLSLNTGADALKLYNLSHIVAKWLSIDNFFIIQIDNSTCASSDEIDIIDTISQGEINRAFFEKRSPMIINGSNVRKNCVLLAMLIYFSIIFSWHIYFIPDTSFKGKRVAVLDGMLCFFGDSTILNDAKLLLDKIKNNPYMIDL